MKNDSKVKTLIPIPNYVMLNDKRMQTKITIEGRQWWRIGTALMESGELALVVFDGFRHKILTDHDLNAREFARFMEGKI